MNELVDRVYTDCCVRLF